MSVEYYTRLERGNLTGVSESILEALARALGLDEAEREHLFDLARTAGPARRASAAPSPSVRSSVLRILDALTAPAYLRDARFDIVAANRPCQTLYGDVLRPDRLPVNLARFMFLDDQAPAFYLDWEPVADDIVAALRIEAGRSPTDRKLTELVGELATRSEPFRVRWAKHDVRLHRTSAKRLYNPLIGEITVTGEALQLPGETLSLVTYTAEPDSEAQDRLDFLAGWTPSVADTDPRAGGPGALLSDGSC